VQEIDVSGLKVFEKDRFSMLDAPIVDHLGDLVKKSPKKTAVLFGIEAHVCVLQTALELLERGFEVHVLSDGTSSTRSSDRFVAFERMRQSGVFITSSESILFQLMETSKHPNFKQISSELLKEKRPESGIFSNL